MFVTEHDNRRVQVLRLPGFEPSGTFGWQQLRSPYRLWLHVAAPGEREVFVTDSFMYGDRPTREIGRDMRDQCEGNQPRRAAGPRHRMLMRALCAARSRSRGQT